MNPDRGHNTQETTDYRARSQRFSYTFRPKKEDNSTAENIVLEFKSSTLYRVKDGKNFTTGLDALGSIHGRPDLPSAPSNHHVSIDAEGYAEDALGEYAFVSDEYGPYIYTIDRASGWIHAATRPPLALVPQVDNKDNFTSEANPQSGRAPNQGFEGLTFDREKRMLWALLQSATIQDSDNGSKTTNRFSRLLGYDAHSPLDLILKEEYVVPLPQSKKNKTRASSEVHIIDSTTFLVLARDGNGFGDTDSDSSYKQADLISTKGATNIANSKYDQPAAPVSPGGELDASIVPVSYTPFINLVDPDQLAKFGLHTGGDFDRNLIASKLESLAVAPLINTNSKPSGDHLLFVVSDNDFITTNGHQAAEAPDGSYVIAPYSDPYAEEHGDQDTQVFIYQVSLPGYSQGNRPN